MFLKKTGHLTISCQTGNISTPHFGGEKGRDWSDAGRGVSIDFTRVRIFAQKVKAKSSLSQVK